MTSQLEQPDQYACAAAWAALSAAHAIVTEQISAALAGSCGLSINEFEVLLRVSRAAGPGLRQGLLALGEKNGWRCFIPKMEYCTDNAAMIAIAGYYKFLNGEFTSQNVTPLARMPL